MSLSAPRVQETTTTIGTGAVSLGGATNSGSRTFASQFADGALVGYAIISESDPTQWEQGIGTYSASSNAIARTYVAAGTNGTSPVNLSAGAKLVLSVQPAANVGEAWSAATAYSPGDTCTNGGITWYALAVNINSQPTSSNSNWSGMGASGGGGSGTVTSVALSVPSWLAVSGSPVTSSGTLSVSGASGQPANQFLATPNGSSGAPSIRPIVAQDLPTSGVVSGTYGDATHAMSATIDEYGRITSANEIALPNYSAGAGIEIASGVISSSTGSSQVIGYVATYSALPASPPAGVQSFLVQADGLIYTWNGSAWPAQSYGVAVSDNRLARFGVPQLSAFDAPIGTSMTWQQFGNRISIATSIATPSNVLLMQSIPSPPYTIDAELGVACTAPPSAGALVVGIGVSNGTAMRCLYSGFWQTNGTTPQIECSSWADPQTIVSPATFHYGVGFDFTPLRTYLRITDDGSIRNFFSSNNGCDWAPWMGTTGESNTTGVSNASKGVLFVRGAPGAGNSRAFVYGWRVTPSVLPFNG